MIPVCFPLATEQDGVGRKHLGETDQKGHIGWGSTDKNSIIIVPA